MAHYAKVTLHNMKVVNVIVADEEYVNKFANEPNIEYVQTSYNTVNGVHSNGGTPLRKNYAAIGYTYDRDLDAFYPSQPYASWTLNETTCRWEAPVAMPTDDNYYTWNEDNQAWETSDD